MSIEKTKIQTVKFDENNTRVFFEKFIIFSDELLETDLEDLSFNINPECPITLTPYVFAGYITNGNGIHKWIFAISRRPDEVLQALNNELTCNFSLTSGQLLVNPSKLDNKQIVLSHLILQGDLPEKEIALSKLKASIRPEYLDENFKVIFPRQ